MYDMNCEPGHSELVEQVVHVTEQYQAGSERLEKLYQAMEQANRFQWPSLPTFNV